MKKPNILLIVIDSLRSDYVYEKNKTSLTPNLDLFLKNGTCFEQAISSAASTILAIGSLLTGKYPFKIGLGEKNFQKLPPSVNNFMKILKNNGYNTFATAPKVATDFGLTCDFENPDKDYDNYFSLFAGLGDKILEKLKNHTIDEPWFFYIHIFDLHTPVVVPSKFNDEKFGDSQYEKMISAIDNWLGKLFQLIDSEQTFTIITADHGEYVPFLETKNGKIDLEPSSAEKTLWKIGNKIPKDLYPIKRKMGSIIRTSREKIKSTKINENTLSPYEKRILLESRMSTGHRMYDDLLKIPLIYSGPHIPKNKKIPQLVRQVDILPTIMELLKIDLSHEIDGKSLVPLLKNKIFEESISYIESPPSISEITEKFVGLRTSKYKFIQNVENDEKSYELYDLEKDPLEEKNLAQENPKKIQEFKDLMNNLRKEKTFVKSTEPDIDERKRVEDVLKKLGYT